MLVKNLFYILAIIGLSFSIGCSSAATNPIAEEKPSIEYKETRWTIIEERGTVEDIIGEVIYNAPLAQTKGEIIDTTSKYGSMIVRLSVNFTDPFKDDQIICKFYDWDDFRYLKEGNIIEIKGYVRELEEVDLDDCWIVRSLNY